LINTHPLVLDHAARAVVDGAIRRVAEVRGWTMITSNTRTNHVHTVVAASDHTPEEILRQFKAWSTRALRESGRIEADRPVWTRHGSTRYLWDQHSIASAAAYVRDGQDGHRWDENLNPSRGA
jgi:REP element-mobilizing transposase RayT